MSPQSNSFTPHDSVLYATTVRPWPLAEFPCNFLSSEAGETFPDCERRSSLVEHGRRDRSLAETYITKYVAMRSFTAVEAFTPRLFTLRRADGSVCGAFGLRSARGRLFVEQFIDRPMECCIGTRLRSIIERRGIVEVDHLCSGFAAATSVLLAMLFERLHREEFQWAVMAGSSKLGHECERIGLAPFVVDSVNTRCLAPEKPCIFFMKVEDNFDVRRADSIRRSPR